jgi:hypothetical protein
MWCEINQDNKPNYTDPVLHVANLKYIGAITCIYNLFMPRYSWNTAKVGIKHQTINQSLILNIQIYNLHDEHHSSGPRPIKLWSDQ